MCPYLPHLLQFPLNLVPFAAFVVDIVEFATDVGYLSPFEVSFAVEVNPFVLC